MKSKAEQYAKQQEKYQQLKRDNCPPSLQCWIGQRRAARCVAEVDDRGRLVITANRSMSPDEVMVFRDWLTDTFGTEDQ